MNHETPNGAPHGVHVIKAKKGGGAGKWIAGAAVVAALAAGGYYLWHSTSQTSQPSAQYADNTAAPLDQDQYASPAAPAEDASAPAVTPSTETQTAEAAAPARHRATAAHTAARAAPVPEQVVGVTPISATTEGDEIVIPGVRHPVWTRTPSAYRLSTLYPERALERGSEGEASVHCTVLTNGALNCVQVSESPAHSGFGNAALRVARTFRHAPQLADGSDAAGTPVNLRVVFRMAEERRRG